MRSKATSSVGEAAEEEEGRRDETHRRRSPREDQVQETQEK